MKGSTDYISYTQSATKILKQCDETHDPNSIAVIADINTVSIVQLRANFISLHFALEKNEFSTSGPPAFMVLMKALQAA